MATPTAEELEVVKMFREKVSDLKLENATDLYMLKWLRARELNLNAAEDMLRKHMTWRKEEDVDSVMEWVPPQNFATDYDYQISGRDSQGHPILIIPFGQWDVRKILNSSDQKGLKEAWWRNIDQIFAKLIIKMQEASKEFGREITQCILIVDVAGFSMRQLTSLQNVSTILEAVKRFEANNPEILFSFYAINAFRVFQMFFALMKPFLSPRTMAKLEIYTSPDKWLPVLSSRIPRDQLPIEFGGTQMGRKISIASSIDEKSIKLAETEMVAVEVRAGELLKLDFDVEKSKSILKWTFETEGHDIGFCISFGKSELTAKQRYEASSTAVTGTITCELPGTYTLNFDNSYSLLRGKTVYYNVNIIEPESILS